MFGCLKREAFQTTSRNCSSSLKDKDTMLMVFTAKIWKNELKILMTYMILIISCCNDSKLSLGLYLSIRKLSFINRTKRSFTKEVCFTKAVRSWLKLCHSVKLCFHWEFAVLRETSSASCFLDSAMVSRGNPFSTYNGWPESQELWAFF